MGIANKYNRGNKLFTFTIPSEFKYVSLDELYKDGKNSKVRKVNAIYINKKSHYGDAPILATDNELVNLPQHLLEMVNEMLQDEEVYTQVNNGGLGFTIYTYESSQKKTCYSINWVDM